jgi:hypothetical protein
MISLTTLRKIDPDITAHLNDNELEDIRRALYDLGQLAFEDWADEKFGSKYPVGPFTQEREKHKI